MAFIKKIWKDRISQFPNRRTINDGYVTKQVTVGRDEGTITEQGDAFDATNMNDLEQRIEDAYGDVQALVGSEVAAQYNQDNVIFDPVATEGHGTGFVVSSDYIAKLEVGDLADTDISGQAQGEALVWDGEKWVNGTVSTVGNLDDLNDVDTTGKASGDSLRYDGNEWVAKPTTIALTQAEYNALQTKEPNTHYVITDAPNLNPTADDIEYSSGVTVKQAIDNRYTKTETDTELAKKCNYVDLGTGSIHDFLTNTNYPKGIYIVECMRSPDSPTVGYVSFAIIDKPQDAGGYSNIMVNGQGHLYSCLIPSTVPSTLTFNLMV